MGCHKAFHHTCRVLNVTQEDREKEERVQLRKDLQTKIQAETTVKKGTGRMLARSYDELSKVKHVLLMGWQAQGGKRASDNA